MVKHIWSVLCERISIDQETKLASYLTCIEGIVAVELPAVINNLAFGSRWYKDGESEETLRFRLMLLSPDGTEEILIDSRSQNINSDNHRTNIILNAMDFKQSGNYTFRLYQRLDKKWVVVNEIPLNITLKPEAKTKTPNKEKKTKKVTLKGRKKRAIS
ncbi:hypothetical protein BMS3Abin07_00444 [bacterium BMS3Abin07]|nr:hypothetical protein BMS3Abin07_00444 [bacterium BMS3Abin07]GBE32745.1 hypothetical protein BMS3Bbin05_01664 [bacterium BMS3Bbin05]HDZ88983.1 hypothetical protein [Nitrospirota bacterium]